MICFRRWQQSKFEAGLPIASSIFQRAAVGFGNLTGVPVLLNTSFNDNEPIVCRPEEAVDCFRRTRMDVLVLGDTIVTKNEPAPPVAPVG